MSNPFVGEIKMFAGSFAPRGYALCDGTLLAVSQNDALFSLFGTIYGGDGRTTFGLPDLRGRSPIHQGTGPGLSNRRIGAKGGAETHTLTTNQLPAHNHEVKASSTLANQFLGTNRVLGKSTNSSIYGNTNPGTMDGVLANVGGSQAHANQQPYLCINFIVALVGVYPSRT